MSLGKDDASFYVLAETITFTKYILILEDCRSVVKFDVLQIRQTTSQTSSWSRQYILSIAIQIIPTF